MSQLPFPFNDFDPAWFGEPPALTTDTSTVNSADSHFVFPTRHGNIDPLRLMSFTTERSVRPRAPIACRAYDYMGLDGLLRRPPPNISRFARRNVMTRYTSGDPARPKGMSWSQRATQHTDQSAQYSMGTEPLRNVDEPLERPPQWVESISSEFRFGPDRLHKLTNETRSAPIHGLPGPSHVTHHLPTPLAQSRHGIEEEQHYPGLWAEALQLQLIPPGSTTASTSAQPVKPALATVSGPRAHDSIHTNMRSDDDATLSQGESSLEPVAAPSSRKPDLSRKRKDEAVQQGPTFPSFKGRQPPGGACAGCTEAGKKCDGVKGLGIACKRCRDEVLSCMYAIKEHPV
ncbi:hypothetical protein OBBRIDRAFT_796050 [Obba rivulosa]|uniref:Zn(2)-C6 fungal-type domain-containing protein n=1 Tax=Obba rivulosa TaxID=1052685 RepID=A0A8E2DM76_9APHY|nr:hypothetical protein OBBRIDRAFT_796050 [Obba rivulosa]